MNRKEKFLAEIEEVNVVTDTLPAQSAGLLAIIACELAVVIELLEAMQPAAPRAAQTPTPPNGEK